MHPNMGVTLDMWHTAIKDLRNTRKNEVASTADGSGGKSHLQSGKYCPILIFTCRFSVCT